MCSAALLVALPVTALAVADPLISGPVPATVSPPPLGTTVGPSPTERDYPFLSTVLFPDNSGYIEHEFFMEGTANTYTTPALATGSILTTGHPYKTRLVVRRPTDPAKFNGKVIVEWENVTNNWPLDVQWYRGYDYYISKGYAYVGVNAQRAGVHGTPNGLKAWNPVRYGSLDLTAGGTVTNDALRWDVFSQAGKAIASPAGIDPLGGLGPRTLIATGDSQSSSNLATYLNSVHPLDPVYAGFVLGGPLSNRIREDDAVANVKVFKVVSEWEVMNGEARIRRPDTSNYVAWEVAGSSHSDLTNFRRNSQVRLRDVGVLGIQPGTVNCIDPTRSAVRFYLVYHAAYDWMARWLAGEQPPAMPSPIDTPDVETRPVTVARDAFGNALGGIRLPDVTVPISTNTGWNTGGKPPTSDGSCRQTGTSIPFGDATLRTLYPSHGSYVNQVSRAAGDVVKQGFVLPAGRTVFIEDAAESAVGKN